MKTERKGVYIRVRGIVQGVFFRASTRDKALELGLKGTVRNMPDGSVEINAFGDPKALEELIKWCRKGPPAARVTSVEYEYTTPQNEPEGFFITG